MSSQKLETADRQSGYMKFSLPTNCCHRTFRYARQLPVSTVPIIVIARGAALLALRIRNFDREGKSRSHAREIARADLRSVERVVARIFSTGPLKLRVLLYV